MCFLKEPLKTDNFVTVDSFTLAGNELLNFEENQIKIYNKQKVNVGTENGHTY